MGYIYTLLSSLGYDHPLHPTQINMPIGLVIGALILAIVALKRADATACAKLIVLPAFVFFFPAALTGLLDWSQFYGAAWIYPFSVKIVLAIFLFILLAAALAAGRRRRGLPVFLLGIYFLASINVVMLGYFGGQAVFGGRAPAAEENHNAGEFIFRYNCSGCHAYGGNTMRPARTVIGSFALTSREALTAWIRNPPPPMPAYPEDKISDDQARQLADYLNHIWGEDD
jgi:hypothetical protein